MQNYIIIGGSDAGISAALRIKELSPHASVKIFLEDNYPNYSICGIPFYLSNEVKDWRALAHRTQRDIELQGIEIFTQRKIELIDVEKKKIYCNQGEHAYDKLLLATGAQSVIPKIPGVDLPGVYTLRWIDDMLEIDRYITENKVRHATIIGGGYIGVEMADALHRRCLEITLIETSGTVLKTLDSEFGKKVEDELNSHNIKTVHNERIVRITRNESQLELESANNFIHRSELVIVATGAKPNAQLLQDKGIKLGKWGAYQVNQNMETNLKHIYAAGDCIETWHSFLKQYVYLPLGSTAHKQGRIAGENMVGNKVAFAGVVGTQVVKIFNLVVGRTGLHERDCNDYQIPSRTTESEHWDHKIYYPKAKKMFIRITANPLTKELLGMQIIGSFHSEISKRLDMAAIAIQNRFTVDHLNDLDLSYTPPLSSPWDPIQTAAQGWLNTIRIENKQNSDV